MARVVRHLSVWRTLTHVHQLRSAVRMVCVHRQLTSRAACVRIRRTHSVHLEQPVVSLATSDAAMMVHVWSLALVAAVPLLLQVVKAARVCQHLSRVALLPLLPNVLTALVQLPLLPARRRTVALLLHPFDARKLSQAPVLPATCVWLRRVLVLMQLSHHTSVPTELTCPPLLCVPR